MDLHGKLALVTGGAHRVGRAITLSLAEQGCDLLVHYHRAAQAAAQTAAEADRRGGRATCVAADLSTMEGIEQVFAAVDEKLGGLDVLVNSAAVFEPIPLLEATEETWRRTMDLNLRATAFCLQQAARRMRARGGGAIVNISDAAGHRPFRRYPLHSISKAGVEMLTRAAALELAPAIRVNAVVPGPVLKPEDMPESRWQSIAARSPLGRPGRPQDVARAVVFLLHNDYITGESLRVDGGDLLV
jgi:NAD(P)-dependent dehydrogenase (short-subunit alcohol dehydrogenase family)